MKIFLICSVRGASPDTIEKQNQYVKALENAGHTVHYPPRDTNQTASGLDICSQNYKAIFNADEVHIFYAPESQGTHFDLGMTFAFHKPIVIASLPEFGPEKSFPRMITEWQTEIEHRRIK